MTSLLLLACIFLTAGLVVVPIATRLGLGSVLGYLIAGMLISPLLGLLHVDVVSIQHFAEFGVVIMLFLIGMELEPKRLWEMRTRILGLGGGQVCLTMLLVFLVAFFLFDQPWKYALAVGMILALSSTAIVLQTLNEKGMMNSDGGQASFSVLLFQDIAVIPMLALMPLLVSPDLLADLAHAAGDAGDHGESLSLVEGLPGWQATLVSLGAIAAVVLIGNYLTRPVFRFISSANLRELYTAAALVIVMAIALLMTLVGLSPALGTFLAGVVLANSEYRHELEADIDPFRGLLLGLFFITVGAGINFALLAEAPLVILGMAVGVMVLKACVLFGLGTIFRVRGSQNWLLALGLSQVGEFGFVLLSFVKMNGVLPVALVDQLLLVVAISMLITPLLFIFRERVISPIYYKKQEERQQDTIDANNRIIIAGRGRMGGIVERMLNGAGYSCTVIDYSDRHLDRLRRFGIHAYYGDATRPDLLHSAGIETAKLLIVTIDDRDQISKLVKYAVGHFPNLHVVSRAVDRDHVYELWAHGCRDIIRETFDSSLRIGRSAFEAMGISRPASQRMSEAFVEMDRQNMLEVADTYDINIPAYENEAMIARIRELMEPRSMALRERMTAIRKDEEARADGISDGVAAPATENLNWEI